MPINKVFQLFFLLTLISLINCGCEYQFVEEDGECEHKNLFQQFSGYDALALALILIFSLLGSIGGAAGGIFFVPIYLLILNFDTQDAISSSICMMGLTQILRMVISVRLRHPFRNRPIIDYSTAALLAPPVFLGNIFGVILNMWLANLIIKIMFIMLIAYTFKEQTKKGIQVWKKEKAAIAQQKVHLQKENDKLNAIKDKEQIQEGDKLQIVNYKKNQVNVEMQTLISYLYQKHKKQNSLSTNENNIDIQLEDDDNFKESNLEPEQIPQGIQQQYDKYLHRESRYVYWNRLIPIGLAFFLVAFTTLLKGSKKFDSIIGVEACSVWFWLLTFVSVPFIIIIILLIVRQYIKENYIKQQVYQASIYEDIEWSKYNVIKFQIIGVIVGFFQSFLGIGGAIIWSPILLSYKMPADVVSYTTQFLALLGAVNNLIQYLIMGRIVWDYVAVSSVIAGISFIVGLKIIMPYFVKKKKRSLIIFCLSVVEIGSLAVVLTNAILQAKSDSDDGKDIWAMKNFCD